MHTMAGLLRQLVALLCLKEVVVEDNVLVIKEVRVLAVLRINVEKDRQVDLFIGI